MEWGGHLQRKRANASSLMRPMTVIPNWNRNMFTELLLCRKTSPRHPMQGAHTCHVRSALIDRSGRPDLRKAGDTNRSM